jgi:hypothetical protein
VENIPVAYPWTDQPMSKINTVHSRPVVATSY